MYKSIYFDKNRIPKIIFKFFKKYKVIYFIIGIEEGW